jgi:hypothetical protein
MNKKYYSLFIVFLIAGRLFAQTNDSLIKAEASLKVLSFLNLIPEGRELDYGFTNGRDFSKAKIEEPYQTYFVSYTNGTLGFVSSNEWRVPVSIDGQYITLLTVQMHNGQAEVVDLGGNILAQKIQEFEKLYPIEAGPRVLIRNTFLKHDYTTTHFDVLCAPSEIVGFTAVNRNATQLLYQLNEAEPIKTTAANFFDGTIDYINSTDTKK